MDEDLLNDLAAEIANGQCVLFAGAGLSMQGGGPGWTELLRRTAARFEYSDPMIDVLESDDGNYKFDYFDIFSDIVEKNDVQEVHNFVAKQLEDISLEEPVAELAEMPWYATFTTNYDTALERELRSRSERNVQRILTESDYPMSGLPSNLLYVQLMGTIERNPGEEGSMVLTGEEKRSALDSRSGIFQRLEAHAANLSFLFVGYSFEDAIFTDVLRGITANLGTPENTYYALFRSSLDESNRAYLESQNIEPIIGDLTEFSEQLIPKVRARDVEDARAKSVPVGNELLRLQQNDAGDFLSSNNPILNEQFNKDVGIKDFFRGNTSSFQPFKKKWHFKRTEEDEVVDAIVSDHDPVVTVSGLPGAGRTYIIKSAVERLISKHNAVALEVFNTDLSPIPSSSEFNQFITALETEANRLNTDSPEFAVLFSKGEIERGDLLQYQMFREDTKIPIYCVFESHREYELPEFNGMDSRRVFIDDHISSDEWDSFIDYLVDMTNEHKLESLSNDDVEDLLRQDSEFFPVMYRAIHPTRESIEEIIDEEYERIPSYNAQQLVQLCALSSSVGVDVPISVCRRYLSASPDADVSYKDVFDLANNEARSLVSIRNDAQGIQHLSLYHPIIAKYMSGEFGESEMDEILERLARSVKLKSRHEAEFINELLISNGVNLDDHKEAPFSQDGLQTALEVLKDHQPARPIIHHLGRFISHRGAPPDEFVPVLRQALLESDEDYALEEDRANVLSTIAHELWEYKSQRLRTESIDHPEIQEIFDYIERARRHESGLYSYTIQSRILLRMAEAQKGEEVVKIVNKAISIVEKGLEREGDYEWQKRLRQRKVELWGEIDEKEAERIAEELLLSHSQGDGYYTLAALDYYKKQEPNQALARLDKAMGAESYPPQAPYLRLQILLEEQYGNYDTMLELAQELERRPDFEESWKSAFIKGVVHFINGNGDAAEEYFTEAWQTAPRSERYGAEYFWNENRRRKVFEGIIGSDLTSTEGHIYEHGIDGWNKDIYFNPAEQETDSELQSGMKVNFELGFSPRGPIGWDLTIADSH
jgi:tetratricopeptide (TPR) repeat protein